MLCSRSGYSSLIGLQDDTHHTTETDEFNESIIDESSDPEDPTSRKVISLPSFDSLEIVLKNRNYNWDEDTQRINHSTLHSHLDQFYCHCIKLQLDSSPYELLTTSYAAFNA